MPSAPVFNISVNLETRTATFTSGLSDAAKAARGSFSDIKDSASGMGRSVGGSMFEAREGVMLLGDEFGVHLPRALTSFVASLGPIGAAMEAAFPALAIVAGVTILIEHLNKLHEATQKLGEDQAAFGETADKVLQGLADKALEAGIKVDELNHDHLDALRKQLLLLDHSSLNDLVQSFETLAKSADKVFADLETHWYSIGGGGGSAYAKQQLDEIMAKYKRLQEAGDTAGAHDFLAASVKSAQYLLNLQEQARSNVTDSSPGGHQGDYAKFEQAKNALKLEGLGYTDKEYDAMSRLLNVLNDQVKVEGLAAQAKKDNATVLKSGAAEAAAREAEATEKAWESAIDRRAVAEQKFYAEQQKRRQDDAHKAAEIAEQQGALQAKATEAVNKLGIEEAQEHEQEVLGKYLNTLNLKKDALENAHRLGLVSERDYAQQMIAIYGEQHEAQMSFLSTQMERTQDPDKKIQLQRQLTEETNKYNDALAKVNGSLTQFESRWTDYFRKMDASTKDLGRNIRVELQGSINTAVNGFSSGFAKMLVEGQSLSNSMRHVAIQVAETWVESAVKQLMAHEMVVIQHLVGNEQMATSDKAKSAESQLASAKAAAGKAFQALAGIPVVGPELGAVAAAGAFALVMGFDQGGLVPGVENYDSVPAMLKPGEAVLPKEMTERLNRAGGGDSGNVTHVHHNHRHQHNWHAIDGASVESMLNKHADKFNKHVEGQLRRMNR